MRKIQSFLSKVQYAPLGWLLSLTVARRASAAQNYFDKSKAVLQGLDLGEQDPETMAVEIIKWVLGLLGLVVVALIIYGGLRWMLARGNEEEVTKAKDILKAALIGLIIILASYGITEYLFDVITEATE